MMAKQKVHVVIYKDNESEQWVASCLEYDVATHGDNEEHAIQMIKEAVELHIEDMSAERSGANLHSCRLKAYGP